MVLRRLPSGTVCDHPAADVKARMENASSARNIPPPMCISVCELRPRTGARLRRHASLRKSLTWLNLFSDYDELAFRDRTIVIARCSHAPGDRADCCAGRESAPAPAVTMSIGRTGQEGTAMQCV